MNPEENQLQSVLRALQERAKELNCIYRVDELLKQSDRPISDVCLAVIDVLPQGWQYPHLCEARIILEDTVVQGPGFKATQWVQSADIIVNGQVRGRVEVETGRLTNRTASGSVRVTAPQPQLTTTRA